MTSTAPAIRLDVELLQPLFAAATHEASAAMCRWTSGLISMSLDEVRGLPLEEVCGTFQFGDELLTMIVLDLAGDIGGQMILCFDEESGRHLAACLLNRSRETSPEWTELEKSALMETGNILSCAYLNAITRLTDAELIPSPPYFVQDFGASVLQQALMTQAAMCDEVLICRTIFHRAGEQLDWSVFFVPNDGLRQRMASTLCK